MKKLGKKGSTGRILPVARGAVSEKGLPREIAHPDKVIEAAEKAPRVFNIGAYFPAIREMRGKGYSWRGIAKWLTQFGIEVSYVHLRRLFIKEEKRLLKINKAKLRELNFPEGTGLEDRFIGARWGQDPEERLSASDAEDEDDSEEAP